MPDISRKAGSVDFLPSILKFTKKGFYHWKGFLLLKKLSEREEGLESTCQFLDLPRQAAICVEHIPYLL
jgi:hypothetical protein